LNVPSLGAFGGTSVACLLLKFCPNSSHHTLMIGGTGLVLSLGINLYRRCEAKTFLHGFATGLVTTMVVSVPFLLYPCIFKTHDVAVRVPPIFESELLKELPLEHKRAVIRWLRTPIDKTIQGDIILDDTV